MFPRGITGDVVARKAVLTIVGCLASLLVTYAFLVGTHELIVRLDDKQSPPDVIELTERASR
jgi:hypothetical protein